MGTAELKQLILDRVEGREGDKISEKVRAANEQLMPLFDALAAQNPTPNLPDQTPLMLGVWRSVWSTIPFQDIVPGRSLDQSYQIFADNGYYANVARYQLSNKIPLVNRFARGLLNYDLMIIQSYAIAEAPEAEAPEAVATEPNTQQAWDIENVSIRQQFRLKSLPLSPQAAQSWFDRAIAQHLADPTTSSAKGSAIPTKGIDRSTAKRYEKVYKSKPKLEHLYIDREFRLVKSSREKNQRPSYTIATRLI